MAGFTRTQILRFTIGANRQLLSRQFASRLKRSIQNISTPENDAEKTRRPDRMVNPKKNPFLPYDPADPVQRGMRHVANNRDKIKSNRQTKQERLSHKEDTVKTDYSLQRNTDRHEEIIKKHETKTTSPLKFTWTDKNDSRTGNLVLRARSRKYRLQTNEIVIEGISAVQSAMAAGGKLKSLYFSGSDTLQSFNSVDLNDVELYKVRYETVKTCTQTDMPDRVLGVFEMPEMGKAISPLDNSIPLTVIIDGIKEPRDLGDLLHSASAVRCEKIISTKGCSDTWSMKALRTGGMAQFKVPIYDSIPWSKLESLLPSGDNVKVFVTHAGYGQKDVTENLKGSLEAFDKIEKVKALELFEEDKTETEKLAESSCQVDEDEDMETLWKTQDTSRDDFIQSLPNDTSYELTEGLEAYNSAPVMVRSCDTLNIQKGDKVVLVVSHGKGKLGLEARKLVYDRCGEYLTLPHGFLGLDLKVASGIVMYEIAKQLHVNQDTDKRDL